MQNKIYVYIDKLSEIKINSHFYIELYFNGFYSIEKLSLGFRTGSTGENNNVISLKDAPVLSACKYISTGM